MPTILLTGGTGGLGRAVCETLLGHGHYVVATHEPGHRSAGHPPAGHENLLPYAIDLTDEAACRALVQDVVDRRGQIDAAVLLVGGFAMGNVVDTDFAQIEHLFRLNFQTAYQVARPVFAQLERQPAGGRIVLVGARPALDAQAGQHMVAYALSKSLILTLSALLNAAGKDKHIVSTVVVPSTIDTPANRAAMPDADPARWVQPGAIAELIEWTLFGPGMMLREPVLKTYGDA